MKRGLAEGILALCFAGASAAWGDDTPWTLSKRTLDVGIVASSAEAAKKFYGEVLGLERLASVSQADGEAMLRFRSGTSVLKISVYGEPRPQPEAGVRAAIGLRLLTLLTQDAAGVARRAAAHGLPEVKLRTSPAGLSIGFLRDFDGNEIELVGVPGGQETDRMQFGYTVSDVEKTRAFYRKLGLAELKPMPMALLGGAMKYSFQAGGNVIKFWESGKELPPHAGRFDAAGGYRSLGFEVKELESTERSLRERGIPVISRTPGSLVIADPDDNRIEFVATKQPAQPGA